MLIFFPDRTLSDGAAEAETRGYFDADNVPPWDTWVGVFEEHVNGEREKKVYLVTWVPPIFVESVSRAIDVNPEGCIQWLEDSDTEMGRNLLKEGWR